MDMIPNLPFTWANVEAIIAEMLGESVVQVDIALTLALSLGVTFVHQIDKRLRTLTVWRGFTFDIGLRVWLYLWTQDLDYQENSGGWFMLVEPQRFFGWYDTHYIPVDDGGIEKRWKRTVYEITKGRMVDKTPQIREFMVAMEALGGAEVIADAA